MLQKYISRFSKISDAPPLGKTSSRKLDISEYQKPQVLPLTKGNSGFTSLCQTYSDLPTGQNMNSLSPQALTNQNGLQEYTGAFSKVIGSKAAKNGSFAMGKGDSLQSLNPSSNYHLPTFQ